VAEVGRHDAGMCWQGRGAVQGRPGVNCAHSETHGRPPASRPPSPPRQSRGWRRSLRRR
jgi:hypothetical protein